MWFANILLLFSIATLALCYRFTPQRIWMVGGKGFGSQIPTPKVIKPAVGPNKQNVEKLLMMYTCKLCNGRNAQMVREIIGTYLSLLTIVVTQQVSKVAYNYGMVISRCRHCEEKHLIADNQQKLDLTKYGKKIEDYLMEQGESVQKLTITTKDLEENYLVDQDGEISLVPKNAGQVN